MLPIVSFLASFCHLSILGSLVATGGAGCLLPLLFAAQQATSPQTAPAKVALKDAQPFLGTWDIPIPNVGPDGEARPNRNCWLELKMDGDSLVGRFQTGSASPIVLRNITVENGELRFAQGGCGGPRQGAPGGAPGAPGTQGAQGQPPQGAQPPAAQGAPTQGAAGAPGAPGQGQRARVPTLYSAVVKDGKLIGKVTQGDRVTEWTGVRTPKWPDTPPARKPGTPVALFNGKDLTGWHPQGPASANRPYNPPPLGWIIVNGALYNPNAPASANIVSNEGEPGPIMLQGDHSKVYYRKVVVTPLI